jgi:superoxide dismutase
MGIIIFGDRGDPTPMPSACWMAFDCSTLEIFSTVNQDSPVTNGHMPLLGLDVWEHA